MGDWKSELKHADVDVDGAIARFSNKEERYIKYLKLFYADENYNKLVQAIDNNNNIEAFEYCHALKGVVANLGFRTMFTSIFDACEILRTGEMEGTGELVGKISDNYNRIMEIIKENFIA